ncbi:unnamed protein product [Gadus morhua 'NCC']
METHTHKHTIQSRVYGAWGGGGGGGEGGLRGRVKWGCWEDLKSSPQIDTSPALASASSPPHPPTPPQGCPHYCPAVRFPPGRPPVGTALPVLLLANLTEEETHPAAIH